MVRQARLLGPILAADLNLHEEIKKRCMGVRKGWAAGGKLWFLPLPKRLVRSLFICLVQEQAITGLVGLTINDAAVSALDGQLCKLLRALMKGKACKKKDGKVIGAAIHSHVAHPDHR